MNIDRLWLIIDSVVVAVKEILAEIFNLKDEEGKDEKK